MWNKFFPTKPGFYWFYGWMWYREGDEHIREPKLHVIEARQSVDKMVYFYANTFIYPTEGHKGYFLPIPTPSGKELPHVSPATTDAKAIPE
jgi:hypothetical protein